MHGTAGFGIDDNGTVTIGYDNHLSFMPEHELNDNLPGVMYYVERKELAEYMIAQWTKFGETADPLYTEAYLRAAQEYVSYLQMMKGGSSPEGAAIEKRYKSFGR